MHRAVSTLDAAPATGNPLDADFLLGKEPLEGPLDTRHFSPPPGALPAQRFSGLLSLDATASSNAIEVLVDTYDTANDPDWQLALLPPFSFQYISDGSTMVPVVRGPQRSTHPYWEIILEPGQTWIDADDMNWSRASLPFSLKERNQNCIHNGLMTFLFKNDGSISRVAWQVASETCLYLKVNLWGVVDAAYQPELIAEAETILSSHKNGQANRFPVKDIRYLDEDFPLLESSAFAPSAPGDISVYGYVTNGIHYRSQCPTRFGPYPFCDALDLPSYSLAKSIFAGLGYMLLIRQWPEFAGLSVTDLVPECVLEDDRWRDVKTIHLLNMKTGLYLSSDFGKDEDSESMQTFFLAETHAEKVRFACEAWPKKSTVGSVMVYHTTDDYLLGAAMSNFLKSKLGPTADIYTDLVYRYLSDQLQLSPLSRWTQRTYDERAQPFVAYGLVFNADDIAKIAMLLNNGSDTLQSLDSISFQAAMFRVSSHDETKSSQYGKVAYSHGFWGINMAERLACPTATWIPFMSGYGGIVVAMFPSGDVYYYFSDSDQHAFFNAAVEANKAHNYCKES